MEIWIFVIISYEDDMLVNCYDYLYLENYGKCLFILSHNIGVVVRDLSNLSDHKSRSATHSSSFDEV